MLWEGASPELQCCTNNRMPQGGCPATLSRPFQAVTTAALLLTLEAVSIPQSRLVSQEVGVPAPDTRLHSSEDTRSSLLECLRGAKRTEGPRCAWQLASTSPCTSLAIIYQPETSELASGRTGS